MHKTTRELVAYGFDRSIPRRHTLTIVEAGRESTRAAERGLVRRGSAEVAARAGTQREAVRKFTLVRRDGDGR